MLTNYVMAKLSFWPAAHAVNLTLLWRTARLKLDKTISWIWNIHVTTQYFFWTRGFERLWHLVNNIHLACARHFKMTGLWAWGVDSITAQIAGFNHTRTSPRRQIKVRFTRLDFDGIKGHIFFKKTKWDSILTALPPFVPELRSIDDVSHFDY